MFVGPKLSPQIKVVLTASGFQNCSLCRKTLFKASRVAVSDIVRQRSRNPFHKLCCTCNEASRASFVADHMLKDRLSFSTPVLSETCKKWKK